MTGRLFVDTNVLVYQFDTREPEKQVRARAWMEHLWSARVGMISAWGAVQERFGLSWWDALIVAAARLAGCSHLLTEDLQHGQDLDGLRVVDPFQVSPDVLISPGS